jgi:hypothetical protein
VLALLALLWHPQLALPGFRLLSYGRSAFKSQRRSACERGASAS